MNITWYLFPLAAVISLVYSATRYELPERIFRRAGTLFVQIIFFNVSTFWIANKFFN